VDEAKRVVVAAALKTTLFLMLVPGMLLVALPAWLMFTDTALFSFGVFRFLAFPLWGLGAAILLWCSWAFTVLGRGTPSPTHPPRRLVTSGLYRFVRNPIYIGVLFSLLGHVFWHPARSILLMPPIVAVAAHLFVLLYEEPHLRHAFGSEYESYCRIVPRWFPRL
jgi:protein-S-isoprenylcysteine O-methyltransferase Ste14